MNCGTALERRCPTCGTPAPAEARFCMNCGATLDAGTAPAAPSPPAARAAPSIPPEERRQVTVLFADLSGYTAFAERLDPEDVKSLVDRALLRLGAEVKRYGGTVDKYIGDNVMAIFGAPVAHEDDAERAVRAGLGMQAAMEEVNAGLPAGAHFALRVGVNTGEVIAGAVGDAYTVVGDTVNVASRLQTAARPGSVTVGERTMRSTDAAVEYTTLEPLELKGKAEPVPAWEAVCLIAEHSVRRVAPRDESPLVGRDRSSTRSTACTSGWCARALAPGDGRGRGGRGQVACPARVRAPAGRAALAGQRCAPAAASPTAAASSSGRSARCCARSAGSWSRTPPRRRGRSCAPTSRS